MDSSNYEIEVFDGINDKPVPASATKASNGADMVHKFNSFVFDVVDNVNGIQNKLEFDSQFKTIGGIVGNYNLNNVITETCSGYLDTQSAIKFLFPINTNMFISEWAILYNNPDDRHELRLYLSGNFLTARVTYNWNGFNPAGFDIYSYTNQKYANNQNLNMSEPDKLNLSVCNIGEEKELHLYNRHSSALNFLGRITYSLL